MRTRTLAAAVVLLALAFAASLAYRRVHELRNEAATYAKLEQGYAALGAEFRIGLREAGNELAKLEGQPATASTEEKIAALLKERRALLTRCATMADKLRDQFAQARRQYEAAARRPWSAEPKTAETEAEQAELASLARDANDLLIAAARLESLNPGQSAPPVK